MENLFFSLTYANEDTLASFEKLKEVLEGTAITVKLNSDGDSNYLLFNYDTYEVEQKKTRGAGRKEVCSPLPLTRGEVAEMRKSMSESEILEQLGLSRSTYYRRLKKFGNDSSDLMF